VKSGLFSGALWVLAASGCASHLSTARTYAELGKHELAVCYLDGHYRSEQSPKARAALVQEIENAARSLEASYQDLIEKGLAAAALGAATRLEGLYDHARRLGLQEFAAVDAGRLVGKARPKTLAQAVQAVDRAEADGRPGRELTALLRTALALDPHNPELSARYDRLRSSLKLSLAFQCDCRAEDENTCRLFLDHLTSRLSEERREFTQLVDQSSGIKNAELTATVAVNASDSNWRRIRSGRAKRKIQVMNKYKEPRLDSQGKKMMKQVQARYQIFERTARAGVAVGVQIRDLRPPGKLLFDQRRRLAETDRRSYITWTGDQRALGNLARVGTDQTPPKNPRELARQATQKLADALAKEVLQTLEGAGN
jgi:hypothetical protein